MTLTKKKMVREIGRRTRLTNREVQEVVEALVNVWIEALVEGEKIEIENLFVLEVKEIKRSKKFDNLGKQTEIRKFYKRLVLRTSRKLRSRLK